MNDDLTSSPVASRPYPERATPSRPGWPELGVAAAAAVVLLVGGALLLLVAMPNADPVAAGFGQYALGGLAPLGAFIAAVLLRIRDVRVFGLRRTKLWWILAAIGIAAGCVALTYAISEPLAQLFPGSESVQSDYRAAGGAGVVALIGGILLGGILTPLGEELLYRGVVANVLQRWGTVVSVLGSAVIFALAHGINAVIVNALIVGVCNALLFRYSRSIWPGVVMHVVFNSTYIVMNALPGLLGR
ncbi:type II CAAX endopeptidase family protein [Sphaerisporangium sp. NPDC051011]|uniref:CPBP family intramembrane glutamic endopeptidase n=1 Tax=Sphaerisporangium sp. NPDC051011 TaxID=3155792 RepID=UPI0033C1D731